MMITEEDYAIPLRPCPFCKAANLLLSDDRYDHGPDDYGPPYSYYVKCWNCWATGTKTPCKYEAIAYWNGKGMANDIKLEIVMVLIVVLFGNIANMAMMHFLKFDPFWVTFGSIVGLVCHYMTRYLKDRCS